jgi:glutamate-1-semialdehyde 2,1-aminomutase
MRLLRDTDPYPLLEQRTRRLVAGLLEAAEELGVAACGGSLGSMWGIFFTRGPVRCFSDAGAADVDLFRRFFHECLKRGVFFAPSAFEAGFLSVAHEDEVIDVTLEHARDALRAALG